jgi:hypothetical protein
VVHLEGSMSHIRQKALPNSRAVGRFFNSPSRADDADQVSFPRQPAEKKFFMLEAVSEPDAIGGQQSRDLVFCNLVQGSAIAGHEPHDLSKRKMVKMHVWLLSRH